MLVTIEISEAMRAELQRLAGDKGAAGMPGVIQDAVTRHLEAQAYRVRRLNRMIGLLDSVDAMPAVPPRPKRTKQA
jgi:hypothetical protein